LKIFLKINTQEQTIIILNRERFLLAKENAALSKFLMKTILFLSFEFYLESKLSQENTIEGK
jgi:hypothetical protein